MLLATFFICIYVYIYIIGGEGMETFDRISSSKSETSDQQASF